MAKKQYFIEHPILREYCLKSCNDESFKRGIIYSRQNRIISSTIINTSPLTMNLQIRGSGRIYSVNIINFNRKQIRSNCDCPYDWGGICKHQVAALIHIDETFDFKQSPERSTENKEIQKPIYIPIEKLTPAYLFEISSQKNKPEDFLFLTYKINIIQSKSLICTILNTDYYQQKRFDLVITSHKAGINLSCTCCNEYSDKLCSHQYYILSELLQQELFPDLIIPKRKDIFTQNILSDLGLNGKVSPKNFVSYYVTKENKLSFKIPDQYVSVIPKNKEALQSIKNTFFILNNHSTKVDLPDTPNESAPNFAIGFLFLCNNEFHQITITPITGKLNKAGTNLISSFYYYDESYRLQIIETKNEEELIRLCQKLSPENIERQLNQKENVNLYNPNIESIKEICHFQYQFLPEITQQLVENPLVYYLDFQGKTENRPNIKKGDLKPVQVSAVPARLIFQLVENDLFIILQPRIEIDGEQFDLNHDQISFCSCFYVNKENIFHRIENEEQALRLFYEHFQKSPIKAVKEHASTLIENFVIPLSKVIDIQADSLTHFQMKNKTLVPIKRKIYITGEGNFVLFKLMVEYENDIEVEILQSGSPIQLHGHIIHKHLRDLEYEKDFEEFFRNLHPSFLRQFPYEFYNLKAHQMLDDFWFFSAFEQMKNYNIEVYGLNDLKNFKFNPNKPSISTSLKAKKDWFEADVKIAFGDNKVALSEVKKALIKKEKYIKLNDGTFGIMPDKWLKKFQEYLRHGEIKKEKILFSKTKFSIIDHLFDQIKDSKTILELAEKRNRLKNFEQIENTQLPKDINAQLRNYQIEGYHWLNFLHEFKWGGILADDMGLGKTLQAITFLKKVSHNSPLPSLVIVPTTLIFNWQNEFKKFCPSLNVLFHFGINRIKELDYLLNFNIVVTTYGLAINDLEFLKETTFNYVILDESQSIKNPSSKRYKAVNLLKANNRIAMTGTPIENGTFDLYAQMNFVNPGIFGSIKHFRENYALPIDKEANMERAAELQKIIAPFIIRRTKEQVAKELPPKTEDIIYCTMENEQRKIYDAYRNKIRDQILNHLENTSFEQSKIHILEGLTKLRQICDSPELLSDNESYGNQSVKINELIKHITQKTANHKIVVFSQYVKMLNLIKFKIDNLNISYEYLDGRCKSNQRKASVEHFQNNKECRIFLISLKAGGTGINLTAADYVYIVDPWWNPAVENQAIDRCYRIGQDKKVFAYRMICKDTIEEKIIEHQQEKRKVAEGIIKTEESFIKQLTKDDLLSVLG